MENIVRGCGKRIAGGIYIVTDVTNNPLAIPINAFLFDPSWVPTDNEGNMHFPNAVGLHMVENPWEEGVVDVWDWIGEEHYAYFPDFWEETMRYGLSRRISGTADFDLLSKKSQIIGFHRKGVLSATKEFYHDLEDAHEHGTGMDLCPHNIGEEHICIRYLWQLVGEIDTDVSRFHEVTMPRHGSKAQFTYDAAYAPCWTKEPKYKAEWIPAAMFHLPIHRLEIIEDEIGGLHELTLERIDKSVTDLPYQVVKE